MDPEIPAAQPLPSKTCSFAVISLVAGIGSFCVPILGSVLAIVFGAIALDRIKSSMGALTGHGMAMAGLIMGAVSMVFIPVAAILAGMLLPAFAKARAEARQLKCTSNVHILLAACQSYAADHEDALPANLDDLQPYLGSSKPFTCPEADDQTEVSYELVLSEGRAVGQTLKLSELPPETIIIREKQQNHYGGRTVGCADGSVKLIRDDPDGLRRYGD